METKIFTIKTWPNKHYLTIHMDGFPFANGKDVCISKYTVYRKSSNANDFQKEIGKLIIEINLENKTAIKKVTFDLQGATIEKFDTISWKVLYPILENAIVNYFKQKHKIVVTLKKRKS